MFLAARGGCAVASGGRGTRRRENRDELLLPHRTLKRNSPSKRRGLDGARLYRKLLVRKRNRDEISSRFPENVSPGTHPYSLRNSSLQDETPSFSRDEFVLANRNSSLWRDSLKQLKERSPRATRTHSRQREETAERDICGFLSRAP